ncbi:MAG: hypothetical protein ACREL9_08595 [Gemmatimonadales bacterium]
MNRFYVVLPTLACLTLSLAPRAEAQKPKRDSYVITAAEIQESGATNAYEAIERLRPQFLRLPKSSRLPGDYETDSGRAGIVVYRGDTNLGNLDVLKHINAAEVQEIRYYRPTEASGKLGIMDGSAAIVLTLKP